MNPDTQSITSPTLTADILSDPLTLVDNLAARLWKTMRIPTLLSRAGFNKRSGLAAPEVVYVLLMWAWLKSNSINMFSRHAMQGFVNGHKDVMYDFLKREDTNWRGFHTQIARKVYQDHHLKDCRIKAFVVDDSVKIRRGKKVAGVSLHFDHLTGRTVKGQQVLALGLATETTFMPIDQDIFIGQKQVQPAQDFQDKRSIAAKRYQQSLNLSKPELLSLSVKRAIRNGFEADYLLADAWFGNKSTLRLTETCDLTALLRMKKDKTQYRITSYEGSQTQQSMLVATNVFQCAVRKQWKKIPGTAYQAKTVDAELNLAKGKKEPDQWCRVRLLFVRGINSDEQPQPGKHDWALFLSTDCEMSPQSMLEIYALRWGIEVYFKESKQHLGLLKEQTISFTSHIASISLTAIRYLMLLYAALEQDKRVCEVRNELSSGLMHLNFGQKLWGLFRMLINDTLAQFKAELGDMAEKIMTALEQNIKAFFVQALQLDSFTLALEAQPDPI